MRTLYLLVFSFLFVAIDTCYSQSSLELEKLTDSIQSILRKEHIPGAFVTVVSKDSILLIVFVENAFKHLGKEKDKKSCVAISLEVIENTLHFKCKNSFNTIKVIEEDLEKGKSGIGLVNAKKRLALIYPEAHKLSIIEDEDFFNVDLTLDL